MTERLPGGPPRPFTPAELDGASGLAPDEIAAGTRVARELESLAAETHVAPSNEFTERVMGAIAAEPLPAPARLAGLAIRRRSLGAFVFSVRDAWRVMTSAGFPVAARAQAMALVLVVAALATGSGMATAGALGLFDGSDTPAPSVEQPSEVAEPSREPSADPSAEPTDMSAEPSGSPEPSETAGDESAEPDASSEAPESSDDHGGSGGATATPKPTPTPSPSASDHHDDHSPTPEPSRTPRPSDTPRPDD